MAKDSTMQPPAETQATAPVSPPSMARGAAGSPPNGVRMLLVLAATVAVAFFVYRAVVADTDEGKETGKVTEYSWKLVNPDGESVKLSDYKGRPVLLNVWATWCPPCIAELPSIAKLSKRPELKEANVAVVLVSVDQYVEDVKEFTSDRDLGTANVVVAAGEPPAEFVSAAVPTTYLIAPDGRIVRRVVGGMDWDTDEIAASLVKLADEG